MNKTDRIAPPITKPRSPIKSSDTWVYLLGMPASGTRAGGPALMDGRFGDYIIKPSVTRRLGNRVQNLERVSQSDGDGSRSKLGKQTIVMPAAAAQPGPGG